jgi:cytoskeletal protein RodZ
VKTVTITVNKKTLSQVYNQVKMCEDLGFPSFCKGEPINNLMKEVKRDIKKQKKAEKLGWKELLEFWPMSIVVPGMLLLILWGSATQ